MVTPLESKSQLTLLGDDVEDTARWSIRRTSGSFKSRRLQLLDTMPGVVGVYSEASAALATDLYNDSRVGVTGRYAATPVVLDRTVSIRRGVAWAAIPLAIDDWDSAAARLSELMRSEVARPYRDTIIENRKKDPECAGWFRVARSASCGFCKALADRGAVYKEETAYFASHDHCMCTCAPVFRGGATGPEADVMQYMASGRRRTPKEKESIRSWAAGYEDELNPRKHVKISAE